jgi:hypothetical protein
MAIKTMMFFLFFSIFILLVAGVIFILCGHIMHDIACRELGYVLTTVSLIALLISLVVIL